jgi:prolyl 4-hydroxylase
MTRRQINRLNHIPLIYEVENFLSPEDLAHFLALGEEGMGRAQVSDVKAGRSSDRRTNRVRWITHDQTPITAQIAERARGLVGIPLSHAEKFQLIHYDQEQEYQAHFDAFDPAMARGQRNWVRGGQRMVTLLAYLNEVDSGGHTSFPKLELSVAPTPGKALIFYNCYPNTSRRHPHTLHAGEPVGTGQKWAFNLWFREFSRDQKIRPPVH